MPPTRVLAPSPARSFEFLDAHLTDFGWRQAAALGRHIRGLGAEFRADAVVVSPLTRTLETVGGPRCWWARRLQPSGARAAAGM